jgi:hypothetical protein
MLDHETGQLLTVDQDDALAEPLHVALRLLGNRAVLMNTPGRSVGTGKGQGF